MSKHEVPKEYLDLKIAIGEIGFINGAWTYLHYKHLPKGVVEITLQEKGNHFPFSEKALACWERELELFHKLSTPQGRQSE